MNISEKGKDLIKKYEGCRLTAYRCPSGVWTIGYGHTEGVYSGMRITQAQADSMFNEDMVKYVIWARSAIRFTPNQNQFDAMVSFCYNCGGGALAEIAGSAEQFRNNMKEYCHGGGVVLPGLVRRREEELELFNTPVSADKVYNNLKVGTEVKIKDGAWRGNGKDNNKGALTQGQIDSYNDCKIIIGKHEINNHSDEYELGFYKNGKLVGAIWTPVTSVIMPNEYVKKTASTATGTYTVKNGDTLSGIATRFGTTVEELARINNIADPDMVYVGQVIKINGSVHTDTSQYYTVQSGDNLTKIAKQFGTTINKLKKANNIANANLIYVGQVLKIK